MSHPILVACVTILLLVLSSFVSYLITYSAVLRAIKADRIEYERENAHVYDQWLQRDYSSLEP